MNLIISIISIILWTTIIITWLSVFAIMTYEIFINSNDYDQ